MINQGSQALNQGAFHDQFLGVGVRRTASKPMKSCP